MRTFNDMIDDHIDQMKNDIRRSNVSESSKRRQLRQAERMRTTQKEAVSNGICMLVAWLGCKAITRIYTHHALKKSVNKKEIEKELND
jgi:hypothetical protein